MKNEKKSNGTLVGILIGIIIMLLVFVGLFVTGTIKFNIKMVSDSNKSSGNYTLSEQEALSIGKELYDKATKVFETWRLLPYCGERPNDGKTMSFKSGCMMYETNYKDLEELKSYLATFLSNDIINSKINEQPITDMSLLDNLDNTYTNYLIKDDKLYCRSNTGKGWLSRYLNSYDMEVDSIKDDVIKFKVKIANVSEKVALQSNSKCSYGSKISDCSDDQIEYVDTKFVIKRMNGNWVVTDYVLHD